MLLGLSKGLQDFSTLMLHNTLQQQMSDRSALRNDTLQRARQVDELVATGKITKEQGDAIKAGRTVEPTIEQKLSGLYESMNKAPSFQEVPTPQAARRVFEENRVPVAAPAMPATYDPTHPESLNDFSFEPDAVAGRQPTRLSPEMNKFLETRSAKLAQFPPTKQTEVVPGEDGTSVKKDIFVSSNPEDLTGKSYQVEPTAQQAGANKRVELALGELDPTTIARRADQAYQEARQRELATQQQQIAASGYTRQQQDAIMSLSDNFSKEAQPYYVSQAAIRKVVASSKAHTPASDLSMIFAYNKILDEVGSVREGEQERVAGAMGFGEKISQWIERLKAGTILDDKLRNDILTMSRKLYESASMDQKARIADYSERALRFHVNPRDVIREIPIDLDSGTAYENALDQLRKKQMGMNTTPGLTTPTFATSLDQLRAAQGRR